jgi:RNA polymerase sigma factor (sigma-70 family)
MESPGPGSSDAAGFAATRWTVVLTAARGKTHTQATDALAELCRVYWYPLYAYVRRRGHSPQDAEDLTQEFFARLLARDFLKGVAPEKGKFRAFLLAAMKHFLSNQYDRSHAQKRGGGQTILSLDTPAAECRFRREPADDLTPERLYQRQWALTVLDRVLGRLQGEYTVGGKADLFDEIKGHLTGSRESARYAEGAGRLGMTEGALRVAAHRLRRRYRELLREEIAQTVQRPDEVDEEIAYLLSCL